MSDAPDSRKVVWQAEAHDTATAEAVREALREIVDPEIGLNIIELGLIRDLELAPERAKVTMILTTPFCPYGPAIMEETRKKVADVVSKPAVIEMGTELWEPSMMEEGAGADWGLF
jgi:metal-sulfur cluster biosynthetic enzyme